MDNGASSYRRYLNGDERGFHEIVRSYFDNLVFFIDRYVHDYGVAEDIAIDVYTQLIVNKHRYNFQVSLKTYLFMMGRSRALDYLRHQKKIAVVELSEASQIPSEEPSPEEIVLNNERKRALNDALSQLSDELRLVVHLVYFEDLSCEEAAKVLKKSRKQVYNLLYRAKSTLRTILNKECAL